MNGKRKLARLIVRARAWLMVLLLALAALSATTIGRTRINYDLAKYLSEDTITRKSLEVMQQEFGSAEQLRLMFTDLPDDMLSSVLEKLEARDEILVAQHNPATDVREVDGKRLQLVTLTLRECDSLALVEDLRALFPEAGDYCIGGSAAEQLDIQRSIGQEIPAVMVISVAIVLLVLLLTSHAWLEPLAILVTLAVSILINLGTNYVFPDVSFITFAVCAILQLALSIDYAIMLLHTYNACRDEGLDAKEAMTEALAQCFMRIASSAMTTIAGLLSLLFMSYTIGFDIGLVLSKGIVISMLGVFLFMPSLVLLLEKPLHATRHKPVPFGGQHLANAIYKARGPVAALLILAVAFGAVLTTLNTYSFSARNDPDSQTETARISRVFGSWDPLVLLVPGGQEDSDYELQSALVRRLQELRRADGTPAVESVTAMVTDGAPALRYYTAKDVAQMTGMPESTVSFYFLLQGFGESVRGDKLLAAAGALAAGNEAVAAMQQQLDTARGALEGENYSRMLLTPAFRTSDLPRRPASREHHHPPGDPAHRGGLLPLLPPAGHAGVRHRRRDLDHHGHLPPPGRAPLLRLLPHLPVDPDGRHHRLRHPHVRPVPPPPPRRPRRPGSACRGDAQVPPDDPDLRHHPGLRRVRRRPVLQHLLYFQRRVPDLPRRLRLRGPGPDPAPRAPRPPGPVHPPGEEESLKTAAKRAVHPNGSFLMLLFYTVPRSFFTSRRTSIQVIPAMIIPIAT